MEDTPIGGYIEYLRRPAGGGAPPPWGAVKHAANIAHLVTAPTLEIWTIVSPRAGLAGPMGPQTCSQLSKKL